MNWLLLADCSQSQRQQPANSGLLVSAACTMLLAMLLSLQTRWLG
jgi:hypothetical protein